LNSFNSSIHHHRPQRKDENAFGPSPVVCSAPTGDAARTAPKRIGSDLTAADYSALEARWVDRALADRAGLRRVDSLTGGEIIGRKSGN
jgi:hypothetical protein